LSAIGKVEHSQTMRGPVAPATMAVQASPSAAALGREVTMTPAVAATSRAEPQPRPPTASSSAFRSARMS
jgi:hypothetical protein